MFSLLTLLAQIEVPKNEGEEMWLTKPMELSDNCLFVLMHRPGLKDEGYKLAGPVLDVQVNQKGVGKCVTFTKLTCSEISLYHHKGWPHRKGSVTSQRCK